MIVADIRAVDGCHSAVFRREEFGDEETYL